jgi:hypothetical protein
LHANLGGFDDAVIGKAKRKSNSSSGAIKIVTEKKAKPSQGPDIDYD